VGWRNGCSASRQPRVTIGSGLASVDMIGTSRLGDITVTAGISDPSRSSDNLQVSYGVKATARSSVVCFRGGKAPTRRNQGRASLISFVMVAKVSRLGDITAGISAAAARARAGRSRNNHYGWLRREMASGAVKGSK
jgi:hypothetical protein